MKLPLGFLAMLAIFVSLPSRLCIGNSGSHGDNEVRQALPRQRRLQQQQQSRLGVPLTASGRSGWGIPDVKASLGRLFRFRISVERNYPQPETSVRVVEHGSSVLPTWLHLSRSVDLTDGRLVLCLEGVSGPLEKGKRFYIEVGHEKTTDRNRETTTTSDHVILAANSNCGYSDECRIQRIEKFSQPEEDDLKRNFSEKNFDFVLPDASFKEVFIISVGDDYSKEYLNCSAQEQDPIETVVTVDEEFYNLSSTDCINLLKRFCLHLGLSPYSVQLMPPAYGIQFSQSDWLVAGPGETPQAPRKRDGVVFQWNSGCGKVNDDQMDVLTILEKTARDGSFRDAIGRNVIGWFVTKRENQPRPRNQRRYARAIPTGTPQPNRFPPTPKPVPTTVLTSFDLSSSSFTRSPMSESSSALFSVPSPVPSKQHPARQRSKTQKDRKRITTTSSYTQATQTVTKTTPRGVVFATPSVALKDHTQPSLNRFDGSSETEIFLEPSVTVPFTAPSNTQFTSALPFASKSGIEVTLGTSSMHIKTTEEKDLAATDEALEEIVSNVQLAQNTSHESKNDEIWLIKDSDLNKSENIPLKPEEILLQDNLTAAPSMDTTMLNVADSLSAKLDTRNTRTSSEEKVGTQSSHWNVTGKDPSLSFSVVKKQTSIWKVQKTTFDPDSKGFHSSSRKAFNDTTAAVSLSTTTVKSSWMESLPFVINYRSTSKSGATFRWTKQTASSQKSTEEEMNLFLDTKKRRKTTTAERTDFRLVWPTNRPKSTANPSRVTYFATTAKPTKQPGQKKTTKTARLRNTTGPPNRAPEVRRDLGKIDVLVGTVFRFRIPNDTFHDEDGYTDKLRLLLLMHDSTTWDEDHRKSGGTTSRSLTNVPPNSWVKLNATSQSLYGLPSAEHHGSHEFWLAALDRQDRLTNTRFDIRVVRRPQRQSIINHEFFTVLQTSYERIVQDVDARIDIVRKIAAAFRDRSTDHVTVTDIRRGSVHFYWANSSALQAPVCPVATLALLRDHITNPDGRPSTEFVRALHPHRVESVGFEPLNACLKSFDRPQIWYPKIIGVPTSSTTGDEEEVRRKPKESEDTNFLLYILIPMVVLAAALLLILILCIVCHGYRKRKKLNDTKGIPVIFTGELNADRETGHSSRPVLADEVTSPFQSPPTYSQSLPGSRYSTMKSQHKPYDDDSSSSRLSSDLEPQFSPHSIGRSFPGWPAIHGPPPPYIEPYKMRYS